MPDLTVDIGTLRLKNPVTVASGTYGYGTEFEGFYEPSRLGAIFLKGLTLEERVGNPPPRLVETPSGLLNSIGLQNVGVERFIQEKLPEVRRLGTVAAANICGETIDEYAALAARLSPLEGIDALEVNISCPNVKRGGMAFGASPEGAQEVTEAVVAASAKPVIVKLSPNVTDIVKIAGAVEDGGATAVSMVNTFLGMAIDVEARRPILGNMMGGLSGPAIRPLAVRMVWQVSRAIGVPIIGMGGIVTARDAVEFLLAGATAVSLGTVNFVNPMAAIEVVEGLETFLAAQGVSRVREIVGAVERKEV